jgi:hypothetical protein
MARVRRLLRLGNSKLGDGIWCWNIPAIVTCPGRSRLCERLCYATKGRFRTHTVRDVLAENLEASLRDDFEQRMIREVRRRGCWVVRIHGAGDFYDTLYALKWLGIIRKCRRSRFFFYTRSWRSSSILPILVEMASLKNVRLWFSVDSETGLPAWLPPRVKLALLQADASPVPTQDQGLGVVFRPRSLRQTPPARVPLRLVCPPERPEKSNLTCTECGRCWTEED